MSIYSKILGTPYGVASTDLVKRTVEKTGHSCNGANQ